MSAAARPTTAEDDLAFMRSIVEGHGRPPFTLAVCYLAGGLLYGAQCLFHFGQATGLIAPPEPVTLVVVVGVTITFLAILTWAILKDRKTEATRRGPFASRMMNAAFSATGMANAAVIIVFGAGAVRDGDFSTWLYYGAVVFAVQAAAWYLAWMMRRQGWMLATALGGWVTAVALGLLVREPFLYLIVCTAALFLLFAWPGWYLMAAARGRGAGRN